MTVAVPTGATKIVSKTFTPSVAGSIIDLYIMPALQNAGSSSVQCVLCVVVDGNTTAVQDWINLTAVPGIDTRALISEVGSLTAASHTIDIYLIAYGGTVTKLACVLKGVIRMN